MLPCYLVYVSLFITSQEISLYNDWMIDVCHKCLRQLDNNLSLYSIDNRIVLSHNPGYRTYATIIEFHMG